MADRDEVGLRGRQRAERGAEADVRVDGRRVGGAVPVGEVERPVAPVAFGRVVPNAAGNAFDLGGR